jgi:hypothetical protein
MTHNINSEVTVTGVRFGGKGGFDAIPTRIEFGGQAINLIEQMRYQIRRGDRLTRLFDMTDGQSNFRLRSDSDRPGWRLVAMGA